MYGRPGPCQALGKRRALLQDMYMVKLVETGMSPRLDLMGHTEDSTQLSSEQKEATGAWARIRSVLCEEWDRPGVGL